MHMHYAMSYVYTCIQEWPDSCVHCAKNNPSSFERRKGAATPTTNGYLILSIHTSYILHTLIIDTCALIMNEFCFRPKKKMNEFWLRHVHWSLCWEIGGAGMFGSMTSHIQVHVLSRQVSSCSWIISFWSYNKHWQWFSIVLPRLPDNKRRKISVGWMIKLTLPWDSYPLRGCHVYWVGLLVGSMYNVQIQLSVKSSRSFKRLKRYLIN